MTKYQLATPIMEVKVDSKEIQRLLRRKRYFLPNGKIQKLCAIGKYIILVYDFAEKKPCSSATSDDFVDAVFLDNPMNIDWSNLNIKQNLGWSFFPLDENLDYNLNNDFVNSRTKPEYKFHIPQDERERMDCLYSTTKEYVKKERIPAKVHLVNPLRQKNCFASSVVGEIC